MPQTLHIPALPHVRVGDQKYSWCAYSSKVMRLPGFVNVPVKVYAPPGSRVYDVTGQLTSDPVVWVDQSDLMMEATGHPEWGVDFFGHWDPAERMWTEWNRRCLAAMDFQEGDVMGLVAGWCQRDLALHAWTKGGQAWEWGVGYKGVMPETWVTFESNAWRSAVRGHSAAWKTTDSIVPNCYFASEFDEPREDEGYLLYLGRLIPDKGLDVVREVVRATGLPLKAAGQGDTSLLPPDAEYLGVVGGAAKRKLLAGARALLAPTTYLEPFGGVTIEAAFSGCPPVATDYGVFPETFERLGLHDNVCTTLDDFCKAVSWELSIYERQELRNRADRHFGDRAAVKHYGKVIDYLFSVARGESAWYGSHADLL